MTVENVLVISGDILPLPGYPTSGAGLRAWGLGQGLRTHGFTVDFAMPVYGWREDIQLPPLGFRLLLWSVENVEQVIRDANPDAVVFCHWPAVRIRQRLNIPTVIDFHGPHILERAFQQLGEYGENALTKIDAIRKADYFICAGERQKAYFLSWLLVSGFDVTTQCIDAVPVCLSPDLPAPTPGPSPNSGGGESPPLHAVERGSGGEVVFVYGGVYLPWQDPRLGLTTVAEVLERRGTGVLRLFGGRHPVIPIETPPIFRELEKQLGNHPRVRFEGILPRDTLIENYRRANVAIDLMTANYERELAFTTRTVEYLWCGLPVIYNNYAELSPLIREYRAGWTLDPNDRAGLEAVINEIIDHPEIARQRGRNAQRLIRERLTWDKTTLPLVNFLKSGQMRPPLEQDLPSFVAAQLGEKNYWQRQPPQFRHTPRTLWNGALFYYRQGGVKGLLRRVVHLIRRR